MVTIGIIIDASIHFMNMATCLLCNNAMDLPTTAENAENLLRKLAVNTIRVGLDRNWCEHRFVTMFVRNLVTSPTIKADKGNVPR